MLFFSDPQETVSRFDAYIEEFQRVFRSNDIDFGLADDFVAFARTLKHHTQLRGSLADLVKSVMERENNQVSLRTLLTIIPVASGGPDVGTSDRDLNRPVNLVIDFLISVGGCSQASYEHPDSPCAVTTGNDTLSESALGQQIPADQVVEPVIPEFSSDGPAFDPSPSDYPGSSNTLSESLTRLELNSLQVKHYLDSIDQRISRMEPRLENVPSHVVPATQPYSRDEHEARFSSNFPVTEYPAAERDDQPETTHKPDTASAIPEPLSHLWTRSQQLFTFRTPVALPVLLGLAVILLGSLLYWGFARDATYADAKPPNARLDGSVVPAAASAFVPRPTANSIRTTGAAPVIPPGAAVQPGIRPALIPDESSQSSAQIPLSLAPASPSTTPAIDTETSSTSAIDTLETATTSPGPAVRAYKWTSTPLSADRINVSSGVMATNLISAPKPSYPKLASLTHMQGKVVMQAIISKSGTVENLHVIKGHRLLRSAATSAVRNWRYRPYYVNGRPVEVATIVSVDFTLR